MITMRNINSWPENDKTLFVKSIYHPINFFLDIILHRILLIDCLINFAIFIFPYIFLLKTGEFGNTPNFNSSYLGSGCYLGYPFGPTGTPDNFNSKVFWITTDGMSLTLKGLVCVTSKMVA